MALLRIEDIPTPTLTAMIVDAIQKDLDYVKCDEYAKGRRYYYAYPIVHINLDDLQSRGKLRLPVELRFVRDTGNLLARNPDIAAPLCGAYMDTVIIPVPWYVRQVGRDVWFSKTPLAP